MRPAATPDPRPSVRSSGPRTWLLLGEKLGDNAQVHAIAERLGWAAETRRLVFREEWREGKPPFRPSRFHVDLDASDPLEPPWPDLVLTVGRRPAMVALWLREQAGFAGKLVLVGRPKRWLERFDLVVSPPQYRMPARDNVVRLALPLIRADTGEVARAKEAWRPRFAALARPVTAVLVGGPTQPYRFDAAVASELARQVGILVERDGGCVWTTTSRRTPPDVAAALEGGLPPGSRIHRWSPGAGDNPYHGLLAHADRFVVTGDSISMMLEVASLGRPLAIHELPYAGGAWARLRERCTAAVHPGGPLAFLGSLLFAAGIAGFSRDLGAVHRRLRAVGAASRLGEPFPAGGAALEDERAAVAARVRSLFAGE